MLSILKPMADSFFFFIEIVGTKNTETLNYNEIYNNLPVSFVGEEEE